MIFDLDINSLYAQVYSHTLPITLQWVYEKPKKWRLWYRGGTWSFSYSSLTSDIEHELSVLNTYILENGIDVKMEKRTERRMNDVPEYGQLRIKHVVELHFRSEEDALQFKLAHLDSNA
jgi:hypothetical protein